MFKVAGLSRHRDHRDQSELVFVRNLIPRLFLAVLTSQDKHSSYTDDRAHKTGQGPDLYYCESAADVVHANVESRFPPTLSQK